VANAARHVLGARIAHRLNLALTWNNPTRPLLKHDSDVAYRPSALDCRALLAVQELPKEPDFVERIRALWRRSGNAAQGQIPGAGDR
jgi:hypothetical protein